MKKLFRKNLHKSVGCSLEKVNKWIEEYPKQYSTPKYLIFMKKMLEEGWKVRLYVAKVSKYIFVLNEDKIYKVRFSNHKPYFDREEEGDCDFYVGVSHKQVSTTEQIILKITGKYSV